MWPAFTGIARRVRNRFSVVFHSLPPGSVRKALADRARFLARHGSLPDGRIPCPCPEDRNALLLFLRDHGVSPQEVTAYDAQGTGASRDDPSRPSQAVWHWCDHEPSIWSVAPLGCTPAQRGGLLSWLLRHREKLHLSVDAIVGFLRETAADPGWAIAQTYRRSPEWQHAVPEALGSQWDALLAWIARRYAISDAWLQDARLPPEFATPTHAVPGVNILAHFRYPSGLQVAADNTVAALHSMGWQCSCRDVPTNIRSDLPGRDGFLGLHPYRCTISHLAPEPFGSNSYALSGLAPRPGVYRIGYWYWELEQVPRRWRRQCRWLNEVWAPTRFVAEAMRSVVPIPVIEMPPGIAPLPEVATPRSEFRLRDDRFLFLFAFDMGSTIERKNPWGVMEAFRRTFTPRDAATLAIKVVRGWQNPKALARLHAAAESERIVILDDVYTSDAMAGLLRCADCYVSLHRSEGFGLTLAEAMSLGKPVIATRYSGNLDFMHDENSLLVNCRRVSVGRGVPIYGGAHWVEPSVAHAAECMRWVFDHVSEANAMGERARGEVRERFSLRAAGERMACRLAEIGFGV